MPIEETPLVKNLLTFSILAAVLPCAAWADEPSGTVDANIVEFEHPELKTLRDCIIARRSCLMTIGGPDEYQPLYLSISRFAGAVDLEKYRPYNDFPPELTKYSLVPPGIIIALPPP
jgi:hypothetical protein